MARSAMDHSGRFSEISATRSLGRIPRSARPKAMWRTRRTNSAAEMCTHSPSRFSLTASGLSCRAMACRQTPARVDGMFDFSCPGEILAAPADAPSELVIRSAAREPFAKEDYQKHQSQDAAHDASVGKALQVVVVRLLQTIVSVPRIVTCIDHTK